MPHTPLHLPSKKHPHPHHPRTKKAIPFDGFDRLVLVVSVLYPLSAFPQAVAVFKGSVEGVSVISWTAFLICSILFLAYGIRRRVPPMIVANSIWIVMDIVVIVGVLVMGGKVL